MSKCPGCDEEMPCSVHGRGGNDGADLRMVELENAGKGDPTDKGTTNDN